MCISSYNLCCASCGCEMQCMCTGSMSHSHYQQDRLCLWKQDEEAVFLLLRPFSRLEDSLTTDAPHDLFHLVWFDESFFLNYKWNPQCSILQVTAAPMEDWLIPACWPQNYHMNPNMMICDYIQVSYNYDDLATKNQISLISPEFKRRRCPRPPDCDPWPFGRQNSLADRTSFWPCQCCFLPLTGVKNQAWATSIIRAHVHLDSRKSSAIEKRHMAKIETFFKKGW